MDKLTKEEVLHVANLARLDLNEEEIERFSYQLKEIFDSINKINDVEISTDELFIAPWTNNTTLREDNYKNYNMKEDILNNSSSRFDNFIEVGGVFDE